jgi:hypothetical protein
MCRPSEGRAAGVVELELAITIVDGGCARAAAVREETTMQWRSLTQCSDGGGVSRRWLRPSLVIGIRVVGGKTGGSGEPRTDCSSPTSLLYSQCDGGPPAMDGLDASDQGASQGPKRPFGLLGQ